MNAKWNGIERRISLRIVAEGMVGDLSPQELEASPSELLLHELLVHKVELEMQNEELRRTHIELEEARDRYIDLYEFAPVTYISVDREGLINEINLTGSTLLGVDRVKLLKSRFSQFVAPEDKDRWHRLFMNTMQAAKTEKQEFSLVMAKADGSQFTAYLNCLRWEAADASPRLRVALMDISKTDQAGMG
ncbi:MAG: PAS domain-containing protein [Methylococcales bacterium]